MLSRLASNPCLRDSGSKSCGLKLKPRLWRMDFGQTDGVKAEKLKAMKKFKRNRKTKEILRYVAVAFSAVLLSWSSVWIPAVMQGAKAYFRLTSAVVMSPKFVFFMCNALVITLAAKSGLLSSAGSGSGSGFPDLYDEFVRSSENRHKYVVVSSKESRNTSVHDKDTQQRVSVSSVVEIKRVVMEDPAATAPDAAALEKLPQCSKYGRGQSEKMERRRRKPKRSTTESEQQQQTQRQEEEKSEADRKALVKKTEKSEADRKALVKRTDDMSNEEFNQKVEDFIKKGRQDMRQEEA